MPKRAERRHHEKRVKDKFSKVATKLAGSENSWVHKWDVKFKDGKIISRMHLIDQSGLIRRRKIIAENAVRMAHHPKHQCVICHPDAKELERRRKFEIEKKSRIEMDE